MIWTDATLVGALRSQPRCGEMIGSVTHDEIWYIQDVIGAGIRWLSGAETTGPSASLRARHSTLHTWKDLIHDLDRCDPGGRTVVADSLRRDDELDYTDTRG